MSQKPTLVDVGAEAGVSAITVSRALRQPSKVSPELRKKIDDAIRKLGYVQNHSASNLACNKSNSVIVLIPSITNHVFSDVLIGIDHTLRDTKYSMQIANSYYSAEEEEKVLRAFLNPRPSGVILAGIAQNEHTRKMLADIDIPVVQIMELTEDPIDRCIGFCHKSAGYAATQHLLDAGYENIGFLGAQMDPRSQQRLAGFKLALQNAGKFNEQAVSVTMHPSSVQKGAELFSSLVQQFPDADAVFCNNDDLAMGVLFECQRRGLLAPHDFGICGFNNLGITSQSTPTITSVSTPLWEIGKAAGQAVIENDSKNAIKNIDLGYRLIARESTTRSLPK